MSLGFAIILLPALVLGLGIVALSVWWLVLLIEAVRIPDAQWDAAGQNKLLQIALMVILGVIGTIVYALTARPELQRVGPPTQRFAPPSNHG